MKIGIDIDGVLTNYGEWKLDFESKFFYENYNLEIKNPDGYDAVDIFGVEKSVERSFWDKYFNQYSMEVEPRKFSAEVIEKLKEDGHEVYIVTARGHRLTEDDDAMELKQSKDITDKWLEKNNIQPDGVFFAVDDKKELCEENNIDIMIEDKSKNVKKMAESGIQVICYDNPYNRDCKGENIIRAYTWYDVYAKIKKLGK